MTKINVQQTDVTILRINEDDYISLTDIAKFKSEEPTAVIANWMRNRNAIKQNLIPAELTREQINHVYANEVRLNRVDKNNDILLPYFGN